MRVDPNQGSAAARGFDCDTSFISLVVTQQLYEKGRKVCIIRFEFLK